MLSGKKRKITLPLPPVSKDEVLKDIGYIMSIGNLILGVNNFTVSFLIHYDSLSQNATEVIATHLPYFHLLTLLSQMIKLRFLYIPRTPFYYESPSCPPN